ncbi:hypothetical protein OBBRIDRAFT_813659 [Obba rivulosa]|uniref:RRM domain-containing protein n=1 Tax=Obba rivulosa TaxID=1052685 RepID=A0A8E2DIN4_9APHY|nr:hypothetical protein OBBRIDRAFT_813659 [Obba rivulosa]
MSSQNPVFKFAREGLTVKVGNLAESVSRRDVVELFSSLIGEVRKCEERTEDGHRILQVSFSTQDAAKKALCMSGYNVSGLPLVVTASTTLDVQRSTRQSKQNDARRNLYVLGLPFDLTKSDFVDVFSRYGTVAHAVILATVDNASRRRGFIVMSNHEEAKAAMDGLSRREIKGYTIDVSWAVVQRSQGFLDGGDRTSVLASQSPSPSPSPFGTLTPTTSSGQVSLASTPIHEHSPAPFITVRTTRLRVSNLPSVLFSQLLDLHPLFCPFGDIKKIEILASDSGNAQQGHINVIVEYATIAQAQEAHDGLHGQMYSSIPVAVEFMQDLDSPDLDASSMLSIGDNKIGLNPHAAPFLVHAGLHPDTVLGPMASLYSDSGAAQNAMSAALQNRFLAVHPLTLAPYATHASLCGPLYVPLAGTARPSSAPGT